MAELIKPAECRHLLRDLRFCDMYPERYYECATCGAMFLQQQVMAIEMPGSTERLKALVRALAGLRTDDLPLERVLAAGVTLKDVWPMWPDGQIKVVSGGRDDDADDDDMNLPPAWRKKAS